MTIADATTQILEITDPGARTIASVLIDEPGEIDRIAALLRALGTQGVDAPSRAVLARNCLMVVVSDHHGWDWDRF